MNAELGAEDRALELMERVLDAGGRLPAEYPLVFHRGFPGRLVVVEEEGAVRCACAVLARDLRFPGGAVRAGLIGSVVTEPAERGRGLATEVLRRAARSLRAEGCAIALLWADDATFYEKRGYRSIGHEVDYAITAAAFAGRGLPEDVRTATLADGHRIHDLYMTHASRVERSLDETCALLVVPGMDVLVREVAGSVTAYACMGRGRDLADVVHEWAGLPEEVLGLVHAFVTAREAAELFEPLYLMSPPTAIGLHRALDRLGVPNIRGVLGMGSILDVQAAGELLRSGLAPRNDSRATVHYGDPDTVRLRTRRGSRDFDASELLELLFAPRGERELHEALERELDLDLTGLPFPPFVWGLDSI